jgi:hypothetical protein
MSSRKGKHKKHHASSSSQKGGAAGDTEVVCDPFNTINIAAAKKELQDAEKNATVTFLGKKESVLPTCAPGKELLDGNCLTLETTIEIVKAFNRVHPDKPISLEIPSYQQSQYQKSADKNRFYRKVLLNEIGKRLKGVCQTGDCWKLHEFVNQLPDAVRSDLLDKTYRPHGPGGTFKWMGTSNLEEVMRQYENLYPDFHFLGAVPADFDYFENPGPYDIPYSKLKEDSKLHDDDKDDTKGLVANLKAKTGFPIEYLNYLLKKGYRRFGIIFNTDEHDEPGQHWVAAYADFHKAATYYFDSVANSPDERFKALLTRFMTLMKAHGNHNPSYERNEIQFQYKNTECGVYSVNFVTRMTGGKESYEDIVSHPYSDDQIQLCRGVLWGTT